MISQDNYLHTPSPISLIKSCDFEADMALSIGGDGTFLHTATCVGNKGIPILGINTGHLGFLTDLSGNEAGSALQTILCGQYKVEERTLLQIEVNNDIEQLWPYSLNEVALLKQDSASMISIRTTIDGEYLIPTKPMALLLPPQPALRPTLLVPEGLYLCLKRPIGYWHLLPLTASPFDRWL